MKSHFMEFSWVIFIMKMLPSAMKFNTSWFGHSWTCLWWSQIFLLLVYFTFCNYWIMCSYYITRKALFHMNMHPNNQFNYALKSEVAITLHLYIALLHSLHSITTRNSTRNFFAMDPSHFGNAGKKYDKASGKPSHTIAIPFVGRNNNWNTNKGA